MHDHLRRLYLQTTTEEVGEVRQTGDARSRGDMPSILQDEIA